MPSLITRGLKFRIFDNDKTNNIINNFVFAIDPDSYSAAYLVPRSDLLVAYAFGRFVTYGVLPHGQKMVLPRQGGRL